MLYELQAILPKLIPVAALIVLILAAKWFFTRYIPLRRLHADTKKLAAAHGGTAEVLRRPISRVFAKPSGADMRLRFGDTTVDVQMYPLKPKTSVRFANENALILTQTRRAIGLYSNRGLSAKTHVMGASGIDAGTIVKRRPLDFADNNGALRLLLFTAEPSEILWYDEAKKNNRVIGDGEIAFGIHVAGSGFLRRWMARNG